MTTRLWRAVLLAGLVVWPLTVAQAPFDETFEDDTVGANPSGFYTYSEIQTGGTANVVASGLDGTGKSLEVSCSSCSGSQQAVARFTHDSIQPISATFWLDLHDTGTLNSNTISFQGVGGTSTYFSLQSGGLLSINAFSCTGASSTPTYNTPLAAHKFTITWDWDAKTYEISIDDGAQLITNRPFCDSGANGISDWCVSASSAGKSCALTSGFGRFRFDQFFYTTGPPDPTVDEEPEFEGRPVEPGGIFGDNGAIFGGNKTNLATTLQITETALEISMAIIWILLFTMIGFLSFNRAPMGGVAGGVGGVVWSIAWGLIPMWLVFMLIIMAGAGFFLIRRRA